MTLRNVFTEDLMRDARIEHRKCVAHRRNSQEHRSQRDVLVRQIYATGAYSYPDIAKRLGCSAELIAKIVQGRSG